jgi:hypothetical protein
MTVDAWLKAAIEDAERRGLPELRPLLEALARSTRALREIDRSMAPLEHRGDGRPENRP